MLGFYRFGTKRITLKMHNAEFRRIGFGIDQPALMARIDDRLIELSALADEVAAARMPLIELLAEAPQIRGGSAAP